MAAQVLEPRNERSSWGVTAPLSTPTGVSASRTKKERDSSPRIYLKGLEVLQFLIPLALRQKTEWRTGPTPHFSIHPQQRTLCGMKPTAPHHRFEGTLLRAQGEPLREPGELGIDDDVLVLKTASGEYRMALSGIRVSTGGANDRLIYFHHPESPELSFITTDHRILGDIARVLGPSFAPQVRSIDRLRRRLAYGTAITLGVVAACLWAIWALRDPIAGVVAQGVPIAWEERAGDLLAQGFTANAYDSPTLTSAFDDFVAPLRAVVAESGFNPRFFIVPEKTINAFALPGGVVVVFSEVIEKAASGEEVLGVIAHELGHVTERHVLRNVISSVGLYAVFSLLIGDAVGGIAALANAAPVLLSKSYSRDLERDADEIGFQYLLAANINPQGMVAFFERIVAEEKKTNEVFPDAATVISGLSFLSTHPNTDERIASLKSRIEALPSTRYRNVERSFETVRRALADVDRPTPPPSG